MTRETDIRPLFVSPPSDTLPGEVEAYPSQSGEQELSPFVSVTGWRIEFAFILTVMKYKTLLTSSHNEHKSLSQINLPLTEQNVPVMEYKIAS